MRVTWTVGGRVVPHACTSLPPSESATPQTKNAVPQGTWSGRLARVAARCGAEFWTASSEVAEGVFSIARILVGPNPICCEYPGG